MVLLLYNKFQLNWMKSSCSSCSCNWFFSKVQSACHNIANGIKPGSDSRKTDKHAVDYSKAVCWGVK